MNAPNLAEPRPRFKALHPAKQAKCSTRQIEVFEQIAVGVDTGHSPATLRVLEDRGLIVIEDLVLQPTLQCPWPVIVKSASVPIPVHYAWCVWAAQQPLSGEVAP